MNIFTPQYKMAEQVAAKIYRRCPFNIVMLIIDENNVTLRIEALKELDYESLIDTVEGVMNVEPEFSPISAATIYETEIDDITLEVQVG